MKEKKMAAASVDAYMDAFVPEVQDVLRKLRQVIQAAAPDAIEKISYGMPTFELHGTLAHFAAFKKHIGFYPAPSGIQAFQADIRDYHKTKGGLQFPLDRPMPYDLVSRIVAYRAASNREAAASNASKNKPIPDGGAVNGQDGERTTK